MISDFAEAQKLSKAQFERKEVRIRFKKEVHSAVADVAVDCKAGEETTCERWIAKIFIQDGVAELLCEDNLSYILRTFNRERIVRPFDLSSLDPEFYLTVLEYVQHAPGKQREEVKILLNTHIQTRLGKIARLAVASPLSPQLEQKLALEEQRVYQTIWQSTQEFKAMLAEQIPKV